MKGFMGFIRKSVMVGLTLALLTLVCSGSVLAHPHEKGINPFEKQQDGVSLHCLLKQHKSHLTKHCPHKDGKETGLFLYSGCGSPDSQGATAFKHSKNQQPPIPVKSVAHAPTVQFTRLPQIELKPASPVFEKATPPPQATL